MALMLTACGGGGGTISNDGNPSAEVITITLALTNASGQTSTALNLATPLTLTATLSSSKGRSMAGQLLTFSFSDAELAKFGNDAGTAQTNTNGVATIGVLVGSKSGAGLITAKLSDSVSAQISFDSAGDAAEEEPQTPVGSIKLVAQSLQLGTGNTDKVALSALVLDKNNVLQSDVAVQFSASSGELEIVSSHTESDGVAKAYLSSHSDKSLRRIDVSATVGTFSSQVSVDVVGTSISLSAPTAVVLGHNVTMTADLTDSAGVGIQGEVLTVSSALGNPINASSFVTSGNSGRISFSYQAQTGGVDELKITGVGAMVSQRLAVQTDSFGFTTLASTPVEVPLGQAFPLTLRWLSNNQPQVNKAVRFSTTRGLLGISDSTVNSISVENQTDVAGEADVWVSSNFAGVARIAGTEMSGNSTDALTTSTQVEFVASNASQLELQASPTQIGPGEQSVVYAIVRDAAGNPVKHRTVVFNLNGAPGGQLEPASAETDSQGVAKTLFSAENSTGAANGLNLNVSAQVLDTSPLLNQSLALAVGARTLFFRFGTGNTVEELNASSFRQHFSVFVTDSSGNPVAGQALNVSVLPVSFRKGYWEKFLDPDFKYWIPVATAGCANEDVNHNGLLEPGEDRNGDGTLTPGNVASVPSTITADANGIAGFYLSYPKDRAGWTTVKLTVSGTVAGTENISSMDFDLGYPGNYVSQENAIPANNAYGVSNSCFEAN